MNKKSAKPTTSAKTQVPDLTAKPVARGVDVVGGWVFQGAWPSGVVQSETKVVRQ